MRKFKINYKLFTPTFFALALYAHLASAQAQDTKGRIMGRLSNVALGTAGAGFNAGNNDFPTMIGQVVKAFLVFLSGVFMLLIIYGGWLWMTARGNEEQVTRAKDTIRQSAIGLAIVMGAYLITYFVVNNLIVATGYGN